MAHVQVHRDDISLDSPTLIEGLPGVGLVGKIAAAHLVDVYDMEYYASAHCEGLPEIAVYGTDDPEIRPPVRLYADEDRDLLAVEDRLDLAFRDDPIVVIAGRPGRRPCRDGLRGSRAGRGGGRVVDRRGDSDMVDLDL